MSTITRSLKRFLSLMLVTCTVLIHALDEYGVEENRGVIVIGKCHPSKMNCSECYHTLAESLLSSSDNVFHLSKTFFPPRENSPEFVKVTYFFGDMNSNETKSSVWFWSAHTSHFLHSPHTFQFLSLFFGKPEHFYSGVLNVTLKEDCANANERMMEFLTQRVSPLQ